MSYQCVKKASSKELLDYLEGDENYDLEVAFLAEQDQVWKSVYTEFNDSVFYDMLIGAISNELANRNT